MLTNAHNWQFVKLSEINELAASIALAHTTKNIYKYTEIYVFERVQCWWERKNRKLCKCGWAKWLNKRPADRANGTELEACSLVTHWGYIYVYICAACSVCYKVLKSNWHKSSSTALCPFPLRFQFPFRFPFSFGGLAFLVHLLLAENNGSLMLVNDF